MSYIESEPTREFGQQEYILLAASYTIGIDGKARCYIEQAFRPTADEARLIANCHPERERIIWLDFALLVGDQVVLDPPYHFDESFLGDFQAETGYSFTTGSEVLKSEEVSEYTASGLRALDKVDDVESPRPKAYLALLRLVGLN